MEIIANLVSTIALLYAAMLVTMIAWSQTHSKPVLYLPKHLIHRLRLVWRLGTCRNVILVSHIRERVVEGQRMIEYKTIAHTEYTNASDATTLHTAGYYYLENVAKII